MHAMKKIFATVALVLAIALAISIGVAGSAWAGVLDPYKAQGLVGERPDGLAGLVKSGAPAAVAAKVQEVNSARRAEYARIAKQQGTSVEAVQAVFGKKLIGRTQPGQFYMTPSGQWAKK